jgi:hypothetical protein
MALKVLNYESQICPGGDINQNKTTRKNKMNTSEQLTALQNAADHAGGGIVIHQKMTEDKRKTKPLFFAQAENQTISPVLDYSGLNCFLMGMAKARRWQCEKNGGVPFTGNPARIYDNADVEALDKDHDQVLAALKMCRPFIDLSHKDGLAAYHAAGEALAKARGGNIG